MPRWDDNNVLHSQFIDKTLHQVTDYENSNKYRQNPKMREVSAILNHKLFSENSI